MADTRTRYLSCITLDFCCYINLLGAGIQTGYNLLQLLSPQYFHCPLGRQTKQMGGGYTFT
jgi:hypothetical protein